VAEEVVFFVNVLHVRELDSDEEMERKLEETEAAMDVCILSYTVLSINRIHFT
jgi:hypothetical protein